MNLPSSVFCTVVFAAGVFLAPPARANGPSMQFTEQYIHDNIFDNYYSNLGATLASVTVQNCTMFWKTIPAARNGTFQDLVNMNSVVDAMYQSYQGQVEVYINSAPNGPYFEETDVDGTVHEWDKVAISVRNTDVARRLANAIDHYARLCGSGGPTATDPFEQN